MSTYVEPCSPDTGLVEWVAGWEHLADDEVLDVLVGLQRAQARLAWVEAQALVRLAGPSTRRHEVLVYDPRVEAERVVVVEDEVREEVAAALHRSPGVVHDQITGARLLTGHLAATGRALADGSITDAHARVIVEQVRRHPAAVHCASADPGSDSPAQAVHRAEFDRVCRGLQERVLPAATRQTPAQTRALARRVLAAIDAEGERQRRAAARCTRDVWVTAEEDGLATLVARLDAVTARAIRAAVDAAAADPALPGECAATVGERRAEALAALVLGNTSVSVQLDVTVPLDAFTGPVPMTAGSAGVAMLPDGDLVDHADLAGLLEDPAVGAHLRRLLVDPHTGTAVDLGRTRYQVSEPLRRWITTRDRTCRFPGCRRRATACQIDHVVAWDDGGSTDAANLHALCTRHHQLKTHRGWRVTRDDGTGATTWTSPLGRDYVVEPEPIHIPSAPRLPIAPNDPDPPPF